MLNSRFQVFRYGKFIWPVPCAVKLRFERYLCALVLGRSQVCFEPHLLRRLRTMLRSGRLSYGQIRDRQSGQIVVLTYATLLWQLFRLLIEGTMEILPRAQCRRVVQTVSATIEQYVES